MGLTENVHFDVGKWNSSDSANLGEGAFYCSLVVREIYSNKAHA